MTVAALAGITIVAAVLRLMHLGDVVGNPFYDAAVHTMSGSWHAFLFGALDPSASVSVDKPPVDLWLQVASVKLFGFNLTALKLPQAIAGTLSVPLLYDFVRRPFGRAAGLAAAAALAVLPVAVLTARSDTMDTFMSFLLLLAAWFTLRAAQTDKVAWLLAGGAAVGLAFEVKLFQALVPVPAIALLWLLASWRPRIRRWRALLAASAVALVVAFSWIVPVALTPLSQRPYPIGSTNGSIWNLVFVFNGIDRLKGRPVTTPDTLPPGAKVSRAVVQSQLARARLIKSTASPGRLLAARYGPRIGVELLPALLAGVLALFAAVVLRRRRERDRLKVGTAACLGLWLVTGVVLFSMTGAFHPRYFETLSPAVAAAFGIGICVLGLSTSRWARLLAALAALGGAIYVDRLEHHAGVATDVELALGIAAALVLAGTTVPHGLRSRLAVPAAAALAMVALLVTPAMQAGAVVHSRAYDAERSGAMPPSWARLITSYFRAHRDGTRYSFGSIAPAKAAPLIAADPQPVLMLTSYHSRPLLSVKALAAKVAARQVRYFVIGRRCTSKLTRRTAACPAVARWVIARATDVTRLTGLGHRGLIYAIRFCGPATAGRAPASGRGRSARRSRRPTAARNATRARRAMCVPLRRA